MLLHAIFLGLVSCKGDDPPANTDVPATDTDTDTGPTTYTWSGEYGDRLARLSHVQWENTVVDLLGLSEPTHLSEHFVLDANHGTFDNESEYLFVHPVLWQQYMDAAEVLATRVMGDPELRAHVFAPDPAVDPEAWIRAFGQRAHRAPLTEEQVAAYLALFAEGQTVWSTGNATDDGARHVLSVMLQSPYFLYRVQSEGQILSEDGAIALSAWDLASKLSYALWNTMPDAELSALAESGELLEDDVYRAQVERMLDDERARGTVRDLHHQLFKVENYGNIAPDTLMYPEFGPELVGAMQEELLLFLDGVVYRSGGIREMMLSNKTFVNTDLAALYGVEPVPDDGEMHEVELDPTQRAGLLTLSGRLALQADPWTSSPIRRGAFVSDTMLCLPLPPPPPGVNPMIPSGEDMTTRDRVEAYTEAEGSVCAGCHSTAINPLGWPFEHYGALGEWRDEDNGLPIDATGTYRFVHGTFSYDGAIEFAQIAAEAPQVHDCYVDHLLTYLYQREPTEQDEVIVEELAAKSLAEDTPVHTLIEDLLLSPAFRFRNPPE